MELPGRLISEIIRVLSGIDRAIDFGDCQLIGIARSIAFGDYQLELPGQFIN